MDIMVDRRAIAAAIGARLAGVTNATVYYGRVGAPVPDTDDATDFPADPPVKDATAGDMQVRPYLVLYPGPGGDGPDPSLGDPGGDLTFTVRITAVAAEADDLLALVDRIDAQLNRWTPTVDGAVCGRMRPPEGYRPPFLIDRDVQPVRLYAPLEYVVVATPTETSNL